MTIVEGLEMYENLSNSTFMYLAFGVLFGFVVEGQRRIKTSSAFTASASHLRHKLLSSLYG